MDAESVDLAHAAALGTLSAADQQRLDTMLADADPQWRTEFDDTVRATRESMAAVSSLTATAPPPQLRERLLAQIAATEPAAPTAEPLPVASLEERRTRRDRWKLVAVAAAAAVALLAGGVGIGYSLHKAPEPSLADSVLAASDIRAASAQLSIGGSATVVYSRTQNAAVVVFDDVVAPPADDVYQMWLIADGAPRSAGVVDLGPGTVTRQVIEDLDDARIIAFTVEPPGGSAAPTSDPLAAIDI